MGKAMFGMLKETAREWSADKSPRLAAALAYYTLFSLAPLLLIAISVAGLIFGEEAARGEIVGTFQSVIGDSAAKGIEEMIANASKESSGIVGAIVGLITLLFGASGVFGQLKDALNTVWSIEPKKLGFVGMIRERVFSFAMVFAIGFLLLISLVMSAVLGAMGKYMEGRIPGNEAIWQVVHFVVATGVITVLFALMFRYLPDRRIEWRDVWVGAFFTSILFTVGKFGLGLYLGRSATGSAFGAAGTLVVLLLWVYYSGLIFFFGAEFTEVFSRRHQAASARPARVGAHGSVPAARVAAREESAIAKSRIESPKQSKGAIIAVGVGGAAVGTLTGCVGVFVILAKLIRRLFTWR